jgi:hypothetical protein
VARALGVTVLQTPSNGGPSAARNRGLRAAGGDLVAFLDADDYWDPTHLAETVPLLERFPAAALAFSGVRDFGASTRDRPRHRAAPVGAPADVFLALIEENMVAQSAAVARRGAVLAAGGYDETMRFSEDYDLWLRLALRAPFVASDRVTVNYRVHAGQATRAAERLMLGCWKARAQARGRAAADGAPAEARARLDVALRQAWEADLRWAWRHCDRSILNLVLEQHAVVPESDALRERWRSRARRYWWIWAPTVRTWDRIPQSTKNVLKTSLQLQRVSR